MEEYTYYVGKPTDLGRVKRSTARDWPSLVNSAFSVPIVKKMTRSEYGEIPAQSLKQKAKRNDFIVPAILPGLVRRKPMATGASLVMLDIDDHAESSQAVLSMLVDGALDKYAALAYYTFSSKPDWIRVRVVVAAEILSVNDYPRAVNWVAEKLGLSYVTSESYDIVRCMYLPAVFSDETDKNPLFYQSKGLKMLSPSMLVSISRAPKTLESSYADRGTGTNDVIGFLRGKTGLALEKLPNLLNAIDADLPRDEWTRVISGVKHEYSDQEEEAFAVFDKWCSTGSVKYQGTLDCRATWDSFKVDPMDREPVTLRSVIKMAQDGAGWEGENELRSTSLSRAVSLLRDHVFSGPEKLDQNVFYQDALKILAPFYGGAVPTLQDPAQELKRVMIEEYDVKLSLAAAGKALAACKRNMAAKSKDLSVPWCANWIFLVSEGKWYNTKSGTYAETQAFNDLHKPMVKDIDTKSATAFLLGDSVAAVPLVPVVHRMVWDPTLAAGALEGTDTPSGGIYNTYKPSDMVPSKDTYVEAHRIFYDLVRKLLGSTDHALGFMDWVANMVQHPGKPCRWAYVIHSVQGTGKGLVAEAIKAILGSHAGIIRGSALSGAFNEWAREKSFLLIDELSADTASKNATMLKDLIGNETLNINRKFKDVTEVKNVLNILVYTNHHTSLKLEDNDRRIVFLFSPIRNKKILYQTFGNGNEEQAQAYFSRAATLSKPDMAAGLRYYFESVHEIRPGFNRNAITVSRDNDELNLVTQIDKNYGVTKVLNSIPKCCCNEYYVIKRVFDFYMEDEELIPNPTHLAGRGYSRLMRNGLPLRPTKSTLRLPAVWATDTGMKVETFWLLFKKYGGTVEALQAMSDANWKTYYPENPATEDHGFLDNTTPDQT